MMEKLTSKGLVDFQQLDDKIAKQFVDNSGRKQNKAIGLHRY